MKKALFCTSISILILIILSITCSLIVTYFTISKGLQVNQSLLSGLSIVFFLLTGLIFGLLIKKQGLKYSLIFILVYMVFIICFDKWLLKEKILPTTFLFMIGKCFAYMAGSVIGVNIRKS